jgi:hypothetical protein
MPGFSITLLLLPRNDQDLIITAGEMLDLLTEKDPGSKWRWGKERSTLSTLGEITSAAQSLSSKARGAIGLSSTSASVQGGDSSLSSTTLGEVFVLSMYRIKQRLMA